MPPGGEDPATRIRDKVRDLKKELTRYEKKQRKKRAVRLGGLVLLIVVLAGFMMLFQVRTVNVYGNSRHAAEEISDGLLDGFLMKNTLYLQWKYRNGMIPDTLPFLDSIKVQMKSPFEVRVMYRSGIRWLM